MSDEIYRPDLQQGDRPLRPHEPVLEIIASSVLGDDTNGTGVASGEAVDLAIEVLLTQPKAVLVDMVLALAETVAELNPSPEQLAELDASLNSSYSAINASGK